MKEDLALPACFLTVTVELETRSETNEPLMGTEATVPTPKSTLAGKKRFPSIVLPIFEMHLKDENPNATSAVHTMAFPVLFQR